LSSVTGGSSIACADKDSNDAAIREIRKKILFIVY